VDQVVSEPFSTTGFPEDTRHFPIREWRCFGPSSKARRTLSSVPHAQKALVLRGDADIYRCKMKKLNNLGLHGGPGRDRTDDLFHAMEARSQTAPQAHMLQGCNLSILSAGVGFVNALCPRHRASLTGL
jgi:hypothetical protein